MGRGRFPAAAAVRSESKSNSPAAAEPSPTSEKDGGAPLLLIAMTANGDHHKSEAWARIRSISSKPLRSALVRPIASNRWSFAVSADLGINVATPSPQRQER